MDHELKTESPCPLTGSHDGLLVSKRDRHGNPLRTVICRDSGLVFTDPRPDAESIRHFYREEYRKNYKGVVTPKPKHVLRAGKLAAQRLDGITELLSPGGSILDVGSGGGEFVYTCQSRGFNAHGIEPNRGYAEYSVQAYGIDVDCNFYDQVKYDQESFDCVTMFHVLEHLEDPVGSLSLLSRYLKPNGVFIVEVPNVDDTHTAPHQKWHLGHLFNFNQQTLQAVGIKAGLEPIRCCYAGKGSSLIAIFVKTPGPVSCTVDEVLRGSFDSTYNILRQHTFLSHYLKLHIPVQRCFGKLFRAIREKLTAAKSGRPREILDGMTRSA